MSQGRRPLVAGNWKMNGLKASADVLEKIIRGAGDLSRNVDLLICPPATLVTSFAAAAAGSKVAIGAQDCHAEPSGAFTGDIAAEMIADAGASAVIVGHSERRAYHRETDAQVRAKAQAAWRAGLIAIICIGETKDERTSGRTLDVVGAQIDGSVPDGGDAGTTGDRLRAGLGHRHRTDGEGGGCGGGAPFHSQTAGTAVWGYRRSHPHPLWGVGKAE